MALNFGGSGDYLPFIKYNAKSGRFYKKEGETEVEVQSPAFVADFANIKTGWFYYQEGMAPDIKLDADLSTPAAKPSDKHKRGFKLRIFSKNILGGLGEFGSASMHTCAAINDAYVQFESQAAANAGKVPVLACTQVNPVKDKMGTNYKPVFVIQKWVDRPVELDEPAETEVAKPAAQPVKTVQESEF